MSFDFSIRQQEPSDSDIDSMKAELRSKCTQICAGMHRHPSCPCYAEFASRYWLRLGSFPPRYVDLLDAKFQIAHPDTADAVAKFVSEPDQASKGAWSSLIYGPQGSGKTALVTHLAKSVMKWELVNNYSSSNTKAIYFTARDFVFWQKKTQDFKSSQVAIEYMEGAQAGSLVAWDDVSPKFASDPNFVSALKGRLENNRMSMVVLQQEPRLYNGTLLYDYLGLDVDTTIDRINAPGMMPIGLAGRILAGAGWA